MIDKKKWVQVFYDEMVSDIVEMLGEDVNDDNKGRVKKLLGEIHDLMIK